MSCVVAAACVFRIRADVGIVQRGKRRAIMVVEFASMSQAGRGQMLRSGTRLFSERSILLTYDFAGLLCSQTQVTPDKSNRFVQKRQNVVPLTVQTGQQALPQYMSRYWAPNGINCPCADALTLWISLTTTRRLLMSDCGPSDSLRTAAIDVILEPSATFQPKIVQYRYME
jgi:hypothetical protein